MAKISEIALCNFDLHPNKIFFRSLDKSLSGLECLKLVKVIIEKFDLTKKKSIGIHSSNNILWPLIYLASDIYCREIFIFPSNLPQKQIGELKDKHNIDCIFCDEDIEHLQSLSLIGVDLNKISKWENNYKRSDILFTSGTTGLPKGVRIEEDSFMHVANTLIAELDQNSSDLELLSMPFGHSFGLVRLRSSIISGSTALISDGLKDFPAIYQFSKEHKITGLSLVPAAMEIIRGLLRKKAKEFGQNIRYIELGSSFLSEETNKWLSASFSNAKIVHHYGMTEASRSFLRPRGLGDEEGVPNNWIGNILEGCEYKIGSSEDDQNININKGELFLRGKNLFSGYLGKNRFDQDCEWLSTKDICEERNGKIFLLGRTDNQFNIGGEKIQAEDVENRVKSLETVIDVTAFQISDEILGKKLACLIQISNDNPVIPSELKDRFTDLQSFMRPTIYLTSNNLPETDNGKKIRDEEILIKFLDNKDNVSEFTG